MAVELSGFAVRLLSVRLLDVGLLSIGLLPWMGGLAVGLARLDLGG